MLKTCYLFLTLLLLSDSAFIFSNSSSQININDVVSHAAYIFCIDGGGSKTELQVLDSKGKVVKIGKSEPYADAIRVGSTNINTVGKQGIKNAIVELCDGLCIDGCSLSSVVNRCAVVAGIAGMSVATREIITSILCQYGFSQSKMLLGSDLAISALMLKDTGIILIAGTGSACFGKHQEKEILVGGLGKILGDEGSGYFLGLHAIKAVLAHERGYGPQTVLTSRLRDYFGVSKLTELIGPLNRLEIAPYKIAALAPILFEHENNDAVTAEIINKSVTALATLLTTTKTTVNLHSPSTLYVIGGLFKSSNADSFIDRIMKEACLDTWNVVNLSNKNPITYAVQKALHVQV